MLGHAPVKAPDFPAGAEWLNTDRPLSMSDLRGKVVLLDFWTYCCINCMHIIPDLKRLERAYPNELVVVGVHSAKFLEERETANIRQAVLRYGVEHPVINDANMTMWQEYGVRGWPTVVLIDPEGGIVTQRSGEGVFDAVNKPIAGLVRRYGGKGQLDRRPLALKLERGRMPGSTLSFPGKVLADEASGRLFIADSGHNRVLIASLSDGTVLETIGSGDGGLADGGFAEARLNHPQGIALSGSSLYIADTENHAIRLADLERKAVTTIAGTGQQAGFFTAGGAGKRTRLNSPWDLVIHEGYLYIAMAGSHQLWRIDLRAGRVEPYAGSGREARIDGPLDSSALAQPSGIATDGAKLYFADSEDSSIRSADLRPDGVVETIVGGDLFDFGDRDGEGLSARLQHPLGVAYHDGVVYVADTYNNKIKRVRPVERRIETFLGAGAAGMADGDRPTFFEPGGLGVAGGKLYIADTNNHAIRVADLSTGGVETLQIRMSGPRPSAGFVGETIELPAQTVAPGQATLTIALELPAGYHLNADAPSVLTVAGNTIRNPRFPVAVPVTIDGQATLTVDLAVYYCETGRESLCLFKQARLVLPVHADPASTSQAMHIAYSPTS